MAKHTDKYYIKRITEILDKNGYDPLRKTFHTRATPKERGVYVSFNGRRALEANTREQLLNQLKLLFKNK